MLMFRRVFVLRCPLMTGEFEALTDDESLAALRERLDALGLTPHVGSNRKVGASA